VNRFLVSCIAVAAVGWPVWGQKVETEKADKAKIVHLQTALDHLTVLEMGEPVSAVAVGSSSFRVEWRGNKVFIEPMQPGAATNLFVWTQSGRFNYELDPAGAVPEMIFAIDQAAPNPPRIRIARKEIDGPADPSPDELLMDMIPVRLIGRDSQENGIAVSVTDILARDGQILIGYSIRNGTSRVYMPGRPQVVVLRAPRYRQSLYALRDCQLSLGESARLKSDGASLIEVTKAETQLEIKPGERASGILAIKPPSVDSEPAVLQLNFLAGPGGPVRATLVL
jgi:hypothetical protein